MSKRKKRLGLGAVGATVVAGGTNSPVATTEYAAVRNDLQRVLVFNALYLVLILVVYFTNHTSHYLDKWFAGLMRW